MSLMNKETCVRMPSTTKNRKANRLCKPIIGDLLPPKWLQQKNLVALALSVHSTPGEAYYGKQFYKIMRKVEIS